MKPLVLVLLMLGIALMGMASLAEARGMGHGRLIGNASCPAWSNASYGSGGTGPAGMPMMRGAGYGHGYGPGHRWMQAAAVPTQGQPSPAVPAAPAQPRQ